MSSRINIKRLRNIIIIFCILAIVISFFGFKKEKIFFLVYNNKDFLNECIKNKTYEKANKILGIKQITPYPLSNNEIFIDFYCLGIGIVPSSVYYGFYYISNDKPLGFQAQPVKLEPDGDGWRWEEKWENLDGDNWNYIERITENWYYYEAGF